MKAGTYQAILIALLFGAFLLPGCSPLDNLPTATPAILASRAVATATVRSPREDPPIESEPPAVTDLPVATDAPIPATLQLQIASPASVDPAIPKATGTARPTGVCERAAAGNPIDITIPDDTEMQPGEAFTKVWRLKNAGVCTWTSNYVAEFFSGQSLGEISPVNLPGDVAPGESVDISIDMVAPGKAGKYQANWKLRGPDSEWFGIGLDGSAPFWVKITVVELPTDTPDTPTVTPDTPTDTPDVPTDTPDTPTEPAPTAEPPAVHVSGSVELAVGDGIDLDEIRKNVESGADLVYQVMEDGRHQLSPATDLVGLSIFETNEPGRSDCLNVDLSSQAIFLESSPLQMYVCFRTGEGRPGWLRIQRDDLISPALKLDITTWPLP